MSTHENTWGALTARPLRRYSRPMHYTQLFRNLREAKGLTLEALAKHARCHRNTVINVESGRPVKFKTISRLVQKMGYGADSDDLKSIALLWLESVSGINFSREDVRRTAAETLHRHETTVADAADQLREAALAANLTAEQVDLLAFAARQPELIAILGHIRSFGRRNQIENLARPSNDGDGQLLVAED